MSIDYKIEAKNLIKELLFEPWMSKEDWEEIEKEVPLHYDKLASDLEIGVKNGYSIETQKELIKQIIKL